MKVVIVTYHGEYAGEVVEESESYITLRNAVNSRGKRLRELRIRKKDIVEVSPCLSAQ